MRETEVAFETQTGLSYDEAVERCRQALAREGFGVLTEIDVKATLKKKLDVDREPYLILGACHPPSAHRALSAAPEVGVLLPCNVTVSVEGGRHRRSGHESRRRHGHPQEPRPVRGRRRGGRRPQESGAGGRGGLILTPGPLLPLRAERGSAVPMPE